MHKSLTNFDEFAQVYKKKLPSIALIGSSSEENEGILELLISGEFQSVEARMFSIEMVSQKTENYDMFSKRETFGIFQAEKLPQVTKEFFMEYIKNPLPNLNFLLMTTNFTSFQELKELYPSALSVNLFEERAFDREKRIVALLSSKASQFGISCTPSIAGVFIRKLKGATLYDILGEFDKLLCHIGNKGILEFSDIEWFVEKREKISLWKFRDAFLQRQLGDCLQQLHALLQDRREDPLGIIAFLRTQCLYGLRGFEENLIEDSKFRLFVSYGKEKLYQALSSLFYAESIIKNNLQDPVIAIETLLVRMTKL
ncbi:hypothetical protein [Chlamydia sp. 17-3921]|uniref:hypothetical protein n=1 Tax=Chlamydia sp. 17-3921 TaxID=2675798 RepID=UPI001918B0B7|nr:hypothetical protein [Chlamydia sp. 17-3921]